jgi:hypothetical protein
MLKAFTGIVIFICLCCISCSHRQQHITRSIYYWKTTFKPTTYEHQRLQSLACHDMYIRLCDVDWNDAVQQAVPIAPIHFSTTLQEGIHYTPVVFITQRTLTHLTNETSTLLAANINKYVQEVCSTAQMHPTEIQIDCDWTAGTKEVYFNLLTQLKQQAFFRGKTLSATIRMHQVKYTARNGIPPADRGLLMCYNMGNMKKPGALNSILDVPDTKDYTKNISTYPLPLDVALPLFNWTLLFRNRELKGILRDVNEESIKANNAFQHKEANLYTCTADTFYNGYYLQNGDVLRVESVSSKDVAHIATYITKRIGNDSFKIALFHCDSLTLSKYSDDELEEIYHAGH